MKKQIGVYVVTADFDDLEGWDSISFAKEILVPLSNIGVCVKYLPMQVGGGGFYPYIDLDPRIKEDVDFIVNKIIERGPL